MKLSKYVKLVKSCGYCAVIHVAGSGIWLGTPNAVFWATELPEMEGEDQVRTVLDMTEKAWEKVYLKESYAESIRNIFGMNLSEFEEGEQKTEKIKVLAVHKGVWATGLRCANDGEIIFYNEALTAPFAEEIKNGEYITYTVRKTSTGQRYVVLHNGFDVLAAIMPMQIVTQEYLADLAEFQALCTEQYYREQQRAEAAAALAELEAAPKEEVEQIGMEDSTDAD